MVLEALDGNISSGGIYSRRCIEQIQEILEARYVLLTTSCTHSLELALMALELKPGDEVLLPSFTFVSTANAVMLRGAKPVFVEINESTFNLDAESIKQELTSATVGIVPVHYAGVACDMDKIGQIALESKIWVVEDAAQAFYAHYKGKALGTLGAFGCFSFHNTKNIVCGEGGALVTDSEELFHKAEICREKGTNRSAFLRNEVDKYTWLQHGSSYILAEPLAALLLAQLGRLEQILKERRRIHTRYNEAMAPLVRKGYVRVQQIPEGCKSNYHIFCFLVAHEQERDKLLAHLSKQGIGATFHYVPLHTSPFAQANLGTGKGDFPVTEKVASTLVRLPLFPSLTNEQADRVVDAVKSFFYS